MPHSLLYVITILYLTICQPKINEMELQNPPPLNMEFGKRCAAVTWTGQIFHGTHQNDPDFIVDQLGSWSLVWVQV